MQYDVLRDRQNQHCPSMNWNMIDSYNKASLLGMCRRSSCGPSMAARSDAAVVSSSAPSARDAPCTSFSRASGPAAHGLFVDTSAPCARRFGTQRIALGSGSTTLPTSARICTCSFVLDVATRFRRFCARLPESSRGGSRVRGEANRSVGFSVAWHGHAWSLGAGITSACATTFSETRSRPPWARACVARSKKGRSERASVNHRRREQARAHLLDGSALAQPSRHGSQFRSGDRRSRCEPTFVRATGASDAHITVHVHPRSRSDRLLGSTVSTVEACPPVSNGGPCDNGSCHRV